MPTLLSFEAGLAIPTLDAVVVAVVVVIAAGVEDAPPLEAPPVQADVVLRCGATERAPPRWVNTSVDVGGSSVYPNVTLLGCHHSGASLFDF